MPNLIIFSDANGTLAVEVVEPTSKTGRVKAGISDRMLSTVLQASESFDAALSQIIVRSSGAFHKALANLDVSPDEAEFRIGIKASGELGGYALVLSKVGGEANIEVKLTWRRK